MDIHCNSLVAFDNKVVKTDDVASSLRRLMSPLSQKQTDDKYILNYLPRRMPLLPFRWKDAPGLLLGT